jgi:hypothetical protein
MRKTILVLLVLVLAVDAMALSVSCTKTGTKTCVVSYTGGAVDPNRPRAFAFDVSLSGNKTISSFATTNTDYYIYPGTIQIDANNGTVKSWGSPVAGGGNGQTSMIIEMGSLFSTKDLSHPNPPPTFGTLFTFDVNATTTVTVGKNAARGGVVKENGKGDLPNPVCTCLIVVTVADPNCLYVGRVFNNGLTVSLSMMSRWYYLGKPNCWCCQAQKYGNGVYTGSGSAKVDGTDLTDLKATYGKSYTASGYKRCSDYNLSGKVDGADLTILKTSYGTTKGTCINP